nr:hypothetical protein [Tanacetum cinerariifolium]
TMADMTAPTSQAPTMAPPVRTNDQILPRMRWVQTGYLKFSTKDAFSASPSDKKLESHDTLEDRKDLPLHG